MGRIKCSVASCSYNENADICKAGEIKVKNNFGATDDMEFADMDGEYKARTSVETCCETFIPRKKE